MAVASGKKAASRLSFDLDWSVSLESVGEAVNEIIASRDFLTAVSGLQHVSYLWRLQLVPASAASSATPPASHQSLGEAAEESEAAEGKAVAESLGIRLQYLEGPAASVKLGTTFTFCRPGGGTGKEVRDTAEVSLGGAFGYRTVLPARIEELQQYGFLHPNRRLRIRLRLDQPREHYELNHLLSVSLPPTSSVGAVLLDKVLAGDEALSDFVVEGKDGSVFHCHRAVLAAGSESYFGGMMSNAECREVREGRVPLPHFAAPTIRLILAAIYTGSPSIAQDTEESILWEAAEAGRYFQLPSLSAAAEEALIRTVFRSPPSRPMFHNLLNTARQYQFWCLGNVALCGLANCKDKDKSENGDTDGKAIAVSNAVLLLPSTESKGSA